MRTRNSALAITCLSTLIAMMLYHKWKAYRALKKKKRMLVFSKYPVAGKTKTRLISTLGSSGAATLQLLMTERILDVLSKCHALFQDQLCVELRHYGGTSAQLHHWMGRRRPIVVCRPQQGKDLGERMANAVRDALNEGAESVVVVGTDIPGISDSIVEQTFRILGEEEADMVLGPAQDGGYYLVGLSPQTLQHLGKLFSGIDWGTGNVLRQQVEVAKQLGVRHRLLPVQLRDVDHEEDLVEVERHLGLTKADITKPHWSVVIPILNESKNIGKTVRHLIQSADAPERLEIVLADGQSTDNPQEVVDDLSRELSSSGATLKMVSCERGRGTQLNQGAQASQHKLLLFVHADTILPRHFDTLAWHTLATPGGVAGAFKFGLDAMLVEEVRKKLSWWFLLKMKLLQWGTNKRAQKFELPYGDQGLFLWRSTFTKVGGYPPYRLMEDYEMVQILKKFGHIAIADGPPAITSARRWIKHGYVKVTGLNTLITLAYKCGVPPDRLAAWYYGR